MSKRNPPWILKCLKQGQGLPFPSALVQSRSKRTSAPVFGHLSVTLPGISINITSVLKSYIFLAVFSWLQNFLGAGWTVNALFALDSELIPGVADFNDFSAFWVAAAFFNVDFRVLVSLYRGWR